MASPPSVAKEKSAKPRKHSKSNVLSKRLAPLPISRSRKRARQITTLFHRYTQLKEKATTIDEKNRIDLLIQGIGGQTAYQKASQVSTSYHSTSKWVLGCLAQNGWLYGIADAPTDASKSISNDAVTKYGNERCTRRRTDRRDTRLLEIGAINTELVEAAEAIVADTQHEMRKTENEHQQYGVQKKYRLQVRAIDLHSMHDSIEEVDFLSLPLLQSDNIAKRYDVIVCSMVLNCVPTASKRGEMLLRIVHFLRLGGLVYITIPKTCLNLSPYMDASRFTHLLQHIGLTLLEHSKDSPKVAFFIGQKASGSIGRTNIEWRESKKIRQGRKFRNNFAIVLPEYTSCIDEETTGIP